MASKAEAAFATLCGLCLLVCSVVLLALVADSIKRDSTFESLPVGGLVQTTRTLQLDEPTRVEVVFDQAERVEIGQREGIFVCTKGREVLYYAPAYSTGTLARTDRASFLRSIGLLDKRGPYPKCVAKFDDLEISSFDMKEQPY